MIILGLGSNLHSSFGNRFENISLAISYLKSYKIKVIKESNFYETPSYPNNKNPKFINIALGISTNLSPADLASILIFIEEKLERKRNYKNEPRTCDIDILDYDKKIIKSSTNIKLIIPHPEMHKRNFVLLPLFEITKRWTHPIKKIDIKKLVNSLELRELRAIKLL